MKLLACQIEVPEVTTKAARAAHVAGLAERISRHLARAPVDLVLLPELATISYSRAAFDRLDELAEPLDGETFDAFSGLAKAHRATICFGMPRKEEGRFRIAQVVVGPDGAYVGHHDKLHLAQFGASMEKAYFTKGKRLLVFEVAGLKAAPIICYDHRFPELTRHLCLGLGVDLILHAVAFYRDESFGSWHSFSVSRALENQVYMLSLNRAGPDYGGSIFCPPWLSDLSEATRFGDEEVLLDLQVDPEKLAEARRTYSVRDDRLADYASLDTTIVGSKA
jgi:nitrilase